MALFKYLLDFKRAAWARLRDKRRNVRYPVAGTFPLKASLLLSSVEGSKPAKGSAPVPDLCRSWGGAPLNLSRCGISLQLPPAAISRRGEQTVVTLNVEGHQLALPATVAHFRVQGGSAFCGLKLQVKGAGDQKAYRQLLETVIIGSTLTRVDTPDGASHRDGFVAEQYKSGRKAILTAWREPDTGKLASFELKLGTHCVRGVANRPAVEIFSPNGKGLKMAWSAPAFAFSKGIENGEVRQLFRWIALNAPKTMPQDLRDLMRFFTATRTDWKAPTPKPRKESLVASSAAH